MPQWYVSRSPPTAAILGVAKAKGLHADCALRGVEAFITSVSRLTARVQLYAVRPPKLNVINNQLPHGTFARIESPHVTPTRRPGGAGESALVSVRIIFSRLWSASYWKLGRIRNPAPLGAMGKSEWCQLRVRTHATEEVEGALNRLTHDARPACQDHQPLRMTSLKVTWLQGTHPRLNLTLRSLFIYVDATLSQPIIDHSSFSACSRTRNGLHLIVHGSHPARNDRQQ